MCQEEKCDDKIEEGKYKWCLYEQYTLNNITTPRQILMLENSQKCPQHPAGNTVNTANTEHQAIRWLNE
jgi:hypothetical protein